MVMLCEPLFRAVKTIRDDRIEQTAVPVIHFTPTGQRLDQSTVDALAHSDGAIMICGRYEGVDQRFIDAHVTLELSLGDFVLSGGELAALALLDAVARLKEGVLTPESHQCDSFSDGLLEGPCFSRPETFQQGGFDLGVPPTLLSGNHADIKRWRRSQALSLTAQRRPDLLKKAVQAGQVSETELKSLLESGLYS
jgi:tRNA (guanine37-N1)-methyltransferase